MPRSGAIGRPWARAGLSLGIVTFMLGRRSITTDIKPDGMHRMPLGLSLGMVIFMLGRRSITTGIIRNPIRSV